MFEPGLLALVEGNAWTFGPVATALRLLELTEREQLEPTDVWPEIIASAPRLTPLGYWLNCYRDGGMSFAEIRADLERRETLMAAYLRRLLFASQNILLVGHDREIARLWSAPDAGQVFRYLLLDGPAGVPAPGEGAHHRSQPVALEPPLKFSRLEEALDWADAVVLAGMVLHRQNLLGPAQLRPLLLSARDQVDRVLLTTTNERRYTLGSGAPSVYRDDFRPHLWPASITHLVSEWRDGAAINGLGWLPLSPEELALQLGESFYSD